MNNIKIYLIALLILIIPIFTLSAQEKTEKPQLTESQKTRIQIQELLKKIKEKNKKARDLFIEAKNEADSLMNEAKQKLDNLNKTIKTAEQNININEKGLKKAKGYYTEALQLFAQYEYVKVTELVNKALEQISNVPIVSLTVSPNVFSPDGDGKNDTLLMTMKVISQKKVVEWLLIVKKNELGEEIEIKAWKGGGLPPQTVEWDGKSGNAILLDSASSYEVELIITDENKGKGSSGRLKFKTDIFIIKTDRGQLINISSIKFGYNSAVLKNDYKKTVKLVYDFLLEYPDYKIIIEGHTDASGKAKGNKKLSDRRATSVGNYLIELGMPKEKIKMYGLGESIPKTLNPKKTGLNRRVSFILLKDEDAIQEYEGYIKKLNFKKEIKMNK